MIDVTASSIIEISYTTPYLQSISFASRRISTDELIKETGQYVSTVSFTFDYDYYTRILITSMDALRSLLTNCPLIMHMDISFCAWLDTKHLNLILKLGKSLRCLNFLGCVTLDIKLQKLFSFDTNKALRTALAVAMQ